MGEKECTLPKIRSLSESDVGTRIEEKRRVGESRRCGARAERIDAAAFLRFFVF